MSVSLCVYVLCCRACLYVRVRARVHACNLLVQKKRHWFPRRAELQVRFCDVMPTEVGDVREGRRGHVKGLENMFL